MVGSTHVRVLAQMLGALLVAVCDIEPERARASLDKHGVQHNVRVYSDARELIENEDIDVIHLATPSGAHHETALMAMEAGKHVICEKPLEIRLDRIDQMNRVARERNVRIACVFQNRWNEANRALKRAADEGRFGRVAWAGSFTPWYRPDKYYDEGGWRGTWALDGGGAVMNQSIHAIDLLQWIAGPVKRVSAYAASRIHPRIEVEDTLAASLQFASGAFGNIMGTTAMFPGQPARIEIGGEHGTAVSENGLKMFKFRDERPEDKELLERLAPGNGKIIAGKTGGGANPADIGADLHRRSIEAILAAWSGGKDAETNGVEARKAVAIVLALYESARNNGTPVDVDGIC
jgi:predicted dehydrogenase